MARKRGKLTGAAKAAFLERMAKGRAAAGRRTPARKGAKRRARRRRNPDLMTIAANPAGDLDLAVRRYVQFHGIKPKRALKLGSGRGRTLIALGELREIVYQPRRGQRRGPAFFHQFKPGSVLAVTADGRHLEIVDRRKRRAVDFDRGIVS